MKYLWILLVILSLAMGLNREKTDRHISQIDDFAPAPAATQQWDQRLIEIDRARKYLEHNRQIVVAIIDTGADIHHPALKQKIWINPGESGYDLQGNDKASNGIDDDKNGYVDDVHGWNFVKNNGQVLDDHGHGTHVSGIIARLAPKAKILPLKYFDENSDGATHMSNTIKAIEYARSMGAHIINYSAGGLSENATEKAVIERASRQNILFVAAAGNESSNSDVVGYYPASYDLPNIISVTAINPRSRILPSSNFSSSQVDIAAPGEEITSSLPGGGYGTLTGTSQATAFVSAIAALLMSHRPDVERPEQIIQYLVKTGDWNQDLKGKVKEATQLNAFYALTMAGSAANTNGKDLNSQVQEQIEGVLEESLLNRAPSGNF